GAGSNTTVQSNITCITPHYFNYENTVVSIHGISYFINGLNRCINGGIKPDRKICPMDIFINSSSYAYTRNFEFLVERNGAAKRAIASNHNEGVDSLFLQVLIGLLAAVIFKKFF